MRDHQDAKLHRVETLEPPLQSDSPSPPLSDAVADLLTRVHSNTATEKDLADAAQSWPQDVDAIGHIIGTDPVAAPWLAELVARWGRGAADAAPELVARLARGQDIPVFVHALVRIGDAAVVPLLTHIGPASAEDVKSAALEVLRKINYQGNPSVEEFVAKLVADPSVDVRINAIRTLAAIDSGVSDIGVLQQAVKDADPRVRQEAATALGAAVASNESRAWALIDTLQVALPIERHGRVREELLLAIKELGLLGAALVPVAEAALASASLAERRCGAAVLLELGFTGEPVFDAFRGELGDIERELHFAECLVAVGRPGSQEARRRFYLGVQHPDPAVRVRAILGLGLVGDESGADEVSLTLARLASDESDEVQRAVKVAREAVFRSR